MILDTILRVRQSKLSARSSTVSPLKAIVKIMLYKLLWQRTVKNSVFRDIMPSGRTKSGDTFFKNLVLIIIYNKDVVKSLKASCKILSLHSLN